MARLACVDLPAFPLQLLLRRHPEWRGFPAVVVDEDKPLGVIAWVNERARRVRILPGQRYAQALSLARDLRAGVIAPADIEAGVAAVADALRRFSPDVEPAADEPGTFWVDASGLRKLYASLAEWADAIQTALIADELTAAIVVGFTRFATYAVAKAASGDRRRRVVVLRSRAAERAAARRVRLDRLDFEPVVRDALDRLGVTTVAQLVDLPPGGILRRFGARAHRLHQLAAASPTTWDPMRPQRPSEPVDVRLILDDPEDDVQRLLFAIKRPVDALLARLAADKRALCELTVELELDRAAPRTLAVRPAEPTLDARTLLNLLHLRLESAALESGVTDLLLTADSVLATREQLALFSANPRRDLRAADRALARLRAEYGDDAVVRAVLRDAHLPEAQFTWEPLAAVSLPSPRPDRPSVLIRRVLARPQPLPPQNQHVRDDGWLLRGLEHGPISRIVGPYVVSGGWWVNEVHREYHFAETKTGELLWVYYDRARRRWFLHGLIE